MNRVKKHARMMALALAVCMLLSLSVFAAENGTVWVTESSAEGGTVAAVMTDFTVTDGVIALTYDSDKLTYEGIELNNAYVAMHSVNAEEAGVVRISWVAPGAYELDGEDWLIRVNFSGTSGESIVISGTVNDEVNVDGSSISGGSGDQGDSGESGDQGGSGSTGRPGTSTDTGDDSNLTMAIAVAVVCVIAIVAVAAVMMKSKKGRKA